MCRHDVLLQLLYMCTSTSSAQPRVCIDVRYHRIGWEVAYNICVHLKWRLRLYIWLCLGRLVSTCILLRNGQGNGCVSTSSKPIHKHARGPTSSRMRGLFSLPASSACAWIHREMKLAFFSTFQLSSLQQPQITSHNFRIINCGVASFVPKTKAVLEHWLEHTNWWLCCKHRKVYNKWRLGSISYLSQQSRHSTISG
jgi:hypothetical protein